MKTKTEQLDELFIKWEKETPGYKGHFVRDGIINEDLYKQTKPKILFITKEPNNPKQLPDDFRTWWLETLECAFSYRIAEWSYGLQNDFPQYDEIWKRKGSAKEAIQKIAFMNVKKIGGEGSSEFKTIMDTLIENFENIHQQIKIINPEIIIIGLSWKDARNALFPNVNWIKCGYDRNIGKFNNYKIIDFYHPSSRNAPAAAYSLLQNIIQSNQFENL